MRTKILSILLLFCLMISHAHSETLREQFQARFKAKKYLSEQVVVVRDAAYGADKLQTMDIYAPKNAKNAPVIFMVHGGAWRFGDKASKDVVKNKVAYWLPKGYVLISTNYRMLPSANPKMQAEDIMQAIVYAQKNAASWGADSAKMILMGHSAGAHLVSLVNAAPSKTILLNPILGVVSLDSAALDVPEIMNKKHYGMYDDAFGNDANFWQSVSPIHQLEAQAVPYLLVCSTKRELNSCANAERFAQKANTLNVKASVFRQDLSHMQINENLGLENDYTMQVHAFIESLVK